MPRQNNAILYRMASGIPGDITRSQSTTVVSAPGNPALPFPAYGLPGKIAAGKFVPFAGGETAADLYGFLARPYPATGADAAGLLPAIGGVPSIVRTGFLTVKNNAGVPLLRGAVYIRVANPTLPAKPLGGIEAVADGANTIVIPRCEFTGPADAAGNVEIEYQI